MLICILEFEFYRQDTVRAQGAVGRDTSQIRSVSNLQPQEGQEEAIY